MTQISTLPAFSAIDGNGSFGLVPDPDGHSVWVIANTDFQGVKLPDVYSAPQPYNIAKIDLNTNTVTNQWQYAYGSYNTNASKSGPADAAIGTSGNPLYEPIMWFDADGFVYTGVPFSSAHPNSTIAKNDPSSAFALSGMFGQSGFRNHVNYVPYPLTWKVFAHSAKQYAACICPIGTGGINLLVILNLTDMLIVGNWWSTGIGTVDVFIDTGGTIWAASIDGSGDMQLDGWNFSDGTTAQPANPYGFLDPFLAVSQTRTVPWARFSSAGGGSGQGIGAIRYLSATNQLVTATKFNSPPLSGDLAIINLSDLSQAAFLPNSNYYSIFGGASLYSCFRDSGAGVPGPANSNIIVPGQFEPVPNPEVGSLLSIYDGSLTLLNSYRMAQLIRAADPIALASLNGLHTDTFGPYFPGDVVLQNDFTTILIADSGGALTITVTVGAVIPGTGLTWQGVYDPAIAYHLNDVVVRSSTGSYTSVSFFTAMTTSTGIDPFFASSNRWMPNIQQTQVSGTWTSPASEPLGPVLYFQALQKIVFQFYPGSSTYVFDLVAPTGTITVNKTTVPGASSQNFTARPSWGAPLALVDGASVGSGPLAAGSYSITEDAVPGWLPHISVSNGNPASAIDLAAGANLIVNIVNTLTASSPPGGDHFTPKPPLVAGPVQNIPLDNSPNQVWNVTVLVNDVPVTLSVVLRYNEVAQYWVATIRDINGNVLLDSLPLVTGEGIAQNLLGQFAYLGIGSATIFNASGQTIQ